MKKLSLMVAGCLLALVGCGDDKGRGGDPMCGDPGVICPIDGGPADTGVDTGPVEDAPADRPDTGPRPTGCDVGEACTSTRGCRVSPRCLDPYMGTIGEAGDEIVGHPTGATTVPTSAWLDGYCTTVGVSGMDGCDLNDDTTCCETGAVCEYAFEQMGMTYSVCFSSCTPSLTTNPCRDGYACNLGAGACTAGCDSDDSCRIYRADTNMDGMLATPAMGMMAVDRLTYDTASMATCNTTTFRCEHPAGPGMPHAGSPCVTDSQCEENADCISEAGTEGGWPGGYCLKFGCDVPGVTCAAGGHCQERRLGINACVEDCKVGNHMGTPADPFMPHATCRAGYMCAWDGVGGTTAMVNGGCLPGTYNDVRTPNVGAPCDNEDVCYSPFGAGQCFNFGVWEPSGYCSVSDCSAPGMPADVCGAGATCVEVDSMTSFALCIKTCTAATDCNPGHACTTLDMSGTRGCFPICASDADCRTGETCNIPMGDTGGTCG